MSKEFLRVLTYLFSLPSSLSSFALIFRGHIAFKLMMAPLASLATTGRHMIKFRTMELSKVRYATFESHS